MKKEIGGYLELEHFSGEEFYPEAVAVNNARNALLYILRARSAKKIWLPFFLCESVQTMCKREGIEFGLYHVGEKFEPLFQGELADGEYLYIVNYYGSLSPEEEQNIIGRYQNVIFDHVQAFFQRPTSGADTVYSCRKYFGVPDGGYAFTNARIKEELDEDVSNHRFCHLLGRFEASSASEYYSEFKQNDRSFLEADLKKMSKLTHNLLQAVDYERVQNQREENYQVLSDALGERNSLKLSIPAGPYAYPFYCKNGMQVKLALAQKGIFVPTLWPNVLEQGNELERDFAANILPLPCDQRYGSDDMQRVADEVLKCIG